VSAGGQLPSELHLGGSAPLPLPANGPLRALARIIAMINRLMVFLGMVALLVASLILTYSVFSRYVFKAATDWQDEGAVFCIVGAVFLCGAYVQSLRGHIGIEALASVLPAGVNRARELLVDVLTFVFCAFFAWKSWTLWHEAWVDKMTSSSSWAPPLAIPYGLMSLGMTLLSIQLLLQVISRFSHGDSRS
jgi:TRAP-type C4-dicarboxylate transport system permease small subunit